MGCLRCSEHLRCRIQLPLNHHNVTTLVCIQRPRQPLDVSLQMLHRCPASYQNVRYLFIALSLHTLSWGRHIYRLHITASLTRAIVRARTKALPASPTTRSPIELNLHLIGPPACIQDLAHFANIDPPCFGTLNT